MAASTPGTTVKQQLSKVLQFVGDALVFVTGALLLLKGQTTEGTALVGAGAAYLLGSFT